MKKILVSGLINTETTVKIKGFPIEYYPIDYPFFGISTRVSGVGYNIAKALCTLEDDIRLVSVIGQDIPSESIKKELTNLGISTQFLKEELEQTPTSVVLYDDGGKRQIYCDLKDIQEKTLSCDENMLKDCDLVVTCNINFNRTLLSEAKKRNILVATDVHVLSDVHDDYNTDFMSNADILFLSDERLPCDAKDFLLQLKKLYNNRVIVLGQGEKGAMLYDKDTDAFYRLEAVHNDKVVNTVGAGDALFSSFLHFYHKGISAVESLKRAEIFASVKIGSNGASVGFVDESAIEKIYCMTKIPVQII